jgi:hypothetical protein
MAGADLSKGAVAARADDRRLVVVGIAVVVAVAVVAVAVVAATKW